MHVWLTLTPHRSALPRVISVVHGKGWQIVHLCVEGTSACLLLDTDDRRVLDVLGRVVDVLDVVASAEPVEQLDGCADAVARAAGGATVVRLAPVEDRAGQVEVGVGNAWGCGAS